MPRSHYWGRAAASATPLRRARDGPSPGGTGERATAGPWEATGDRGASRGPTSGRARLPPRTAATPTTTASTGSSTQGPRGWSRLWRPGLSTSAQGAPRRGRLGRQSGATAATKGVRGRTRYPGRRRRGPSGSQGAGGGGRLAGPTYLFPPFRHSTPED